MSTAYDVNTRWKVFTDAIFTTDALGVAKYYHVNTILLFWCLMYNIVNNNNFVTFSYYVFEIKLTFAISTLC